MQVEIEWALEIEWSLRFSSVELFRIVNGAT